jgi:hypothetical protein
MDLHIIPFKRYFLKNLIFFRQENPIVKDGFSGFLDSGDGEFTFFPRSYFFGRAIVLWTKPPRIPDCFKFCKKRLKVYTFPLYDGLL